jgi:hypothetical protein
VENEEGKKKSQMPFNENRKVEKIPSNSVSIVG